MTKIIRYRERRCGSPKEGMRQAWGEYQVVEGRKILGRYDTLSQAAAAHPGSKVQSLAHATTT